MAELERAPARARALGSTIRRPRRSIARFASASRSSRRRGGHASRGLAGAAAAGARRPGRARLACDRATPSRRRRATPFATCSTSGASTIQTQRLSASRRRPSGGWRSASPPVARRAPRARSLSSPLVPSALGDPDRVFVDPARCPAARCRSSTCPSPRLPRTTTTGVGLLIGEFRGDLLGEYLHKIVPQATRVERLRVDGRRPPGSPARRTSSSTATEAGGIAERELSWPERPPCRAGRRPRAARGCVRPRRCRADRALAAAELREPIPFLSL